MFPFRDKNLIGVDIGSYSIKVVKLKGAKGSYTLEAAACVKLPRESASDRLAVSGLISEIIRSRKVGGACAATVISGKSLILRHIYLPQMPEKDLKEAVRWEIRKEVAFPPNELVCDYIIASAAAKTSENMLSIIAFAARKNDVEGTMNIFRDAGLELKVIDAVPSALTAAFDANNGWEEGVNYAMLDIGEAKSTLAIFKNQRLGFAREISYGGADLTTAVAQGMNKDASQAEEYKIAFGLSEAQGGSPEARLLSQSLDGLSTEIHRSFDYYYAQFREGAVSKLFLSGGTSRLKGIEDFLTKAIGISCFTHDPLRKVSVPAKADNDALRSVAPCLNVAVGLATRTSP